MRALVTGGFGYIGGHLVKQLLSTGWDVTILDTMFSAKPWVWDVPQDRMYIINASVCNPDAVRRAMHDVNVVYHLAARRDWSVMPKHALRMFKANVIGTVTVLSHARAAGVDNVVFTSSSAVYGDVIEAEEYGPIHPVNTYGCSKLAAEAACIDHCNLGIDVKILRLFSVWGGQYSDSVVSEMLQPDFTMHGDGDQTRDFIYIGDVVAALIAAKNWDPLIYNIGTGDEAVVSGLYRRLIGEEPELTLSLPGPDEVYRSCAAMDNTYDRVSWRPKVLLADLSLDEVKELCVL